MSSSKRVLIVLSIAVTALAVAAVSAGRWRSRAQAEVTQDFQQTYPLSADGRISLENINGAVRITTWDQPQVKVVAVKRAYRQERLDEVKIKIEANADSLRIKTDYPSNNLNSSSDAERRRDNPAWVDFTLTVPRNARLDSVELINGDLELISLSGDVKASTINGKLTAADLSGDVRVSTVNGQLSASFPTLTNGKDIQLESVNGSVSVTLPSDAQAQIKAETVQGSITNEFGLPVRDGKYFGHSLAALLGNGGARIKLSNVNGRIAIDREPGGGATSRVTNLLNDKSDDADVDSNSDADSDQDAASALIDAQNDLREAQRELEQANREVDKQQAELARAVEESKRAAENGTDEAKEAARDAEQEIREAQQDAEQDRKGAEQEVKDAEKEIQELSNQRSKTPPPPEISRDSQREVQRANRDAQRAVQQAARDAQREVERARPEIERSTQEAAENAVRVSGGNLPAVERDSKSFTVNGTPTVKVETFDGPITIRSWDKSEVSYTLEKRAEDAEQLRGIRFTANQNGNAVTIRAEFDKSFARQFKNDYSVNAMASLEIFVPHSATVKAVSSDGHIRIEGVGGDLQAQTGDGAITIADCTGKADVQTGDGRIDVNNHHGEVGALTGDGSISLDGQFTKLSAATGDGSISLALPAGANVTIESNTDRIGGDGIELGPVSGAPRGNKRWNVGAGGTVFTLHTGDGRITVRQSSASN